jgi:hypothetical protein
LQTELSYDAVHGSFAYAEVTLSEFLSDDLGTGVRIQESVADDLAHEFLGAAVVGFGASLGAEKALTAFFKEESAELEIALTAETEFGRGAINAFRAAFAFDEHGQLESDFVIIGYREGTESA